MLVLDRVSLVITLLVWTFFGSLVGSYVITIKSRLEAGTKVRGVDSHCDSCGHTLAVKDVVPIYAYLKYNGKCRYCGVSIGSRTLRYEIVGGLVFLVSGLFTPIWVMGLVTLVSLLVSIFYLKIK
jgi:prepilin signal peptidase PulO-like enzyme (type II secretory pathway)